MPGIVWTVRVACQILSSTSCVDLVFTVMVENLIKQNALYDNFSQKQSYLLLHLDIRRRFFFWFLVQTRFFPFFRQNCIASQKDPLSHTQKLHEWSIKHLLKLCFLCYAVILKLYNDSFDLVLWNSMQIYIDKYTYIIFFCSNTKVNRCNLTLTQEFYLVKCLSKYLIYNL